MKRIQRGPVRGISLKLQVRMEQQQQQEAARLGSAGSAATGTQPQQRYLDAAAGAASTVTVHTRCTWAAEPAAKLQQQGQLQPEAAWQLCDWAMVADTRTQLASQPLTKGPQGIVGNHPTAHTAAATTRAARLPLAAH